MASRLIARRKTGTVNGKGIEVGSQVCYSRDWLRSTGQYTGTAPFAKGTVTSLEPLGASQLAVIDWGKDNGELPAKVLTTNLILNSNRHLESASKKATTLVSKQSLEQAIQEGELLVDQLMGSNAHDDQLDQLEQAISFLHSVLHKSPVEMQQEGAASLEDYLDDAVMPDMAQKIKQDVDMIAKMKNAGNADLFATPMVASGSDNWVNDRDEKGEPKAPEQLEVPRVAAKKEAAPVSLKPQADINQLSSDTLAKIQKALAGAEDLMNDKAAQAFIAAIAEVLMNRPVEVEEAPAVQPAAPAAVTPAAAPAPVATPPAKAARVFIGGLNIPTDETGKVATSQGGSWFVTDEDTGTIKEDGGRTPEIAEAHSKQDDNTGIKLPATELPSKFAVDMTTGKALKLVDKLGDELKKLYFEAKPVTEALDSRPVREAVESIYRAYDMMGEASKVLNKQNMQEEAEEKAMEIKEKNKKKSSAFLGLNLAAEAEEVEEEE